MSDLQKTFENLLTPPGEGVYTINTAKKRKRKIQQILYPQASSQDEIERHWKNNFYKIQNQNNFWNPKIQVAG